MFKTLLGKWVFGVMAAALFLSAAATAEIRTFTGHTGDVSSVAASPDGTELLTGSFDQTAKLWDLSTGAEIRTFTGHGAALYSVAFSPNGTRILTGSEDGTARLWDAAQATELRRFTGHTGAVLSVAFSPDGTRVVTGSDDYTANAWDTETGLLLQTFGGASVNISPVASAVFSPDGGGILTAGGGRRTNTGVCGAEYFAQLWNAETGVLSRRFYGHIYTVNAAAFSPDGTMVVTGAGRGQCVDDTAQVHDALTGKGRGDCIGHTSHVKSVAFSPDGKKVLTGSFDKTARLWDASSGVSIATFSGHTGEVYAAVFTPDGTRVLTGSADDTAKLWDAATVSVPDVVGQPQAAAATAIMGANLVVGTVTLRYSVTVAAGSVVSQSPAAGAQTRPGAAVGLVTSQGAIAVPDVVNLPQAEAGAAITNALLAVGATTQLYSLIIPLGSVISQAPPAGTGVLPDTAVDLMISRGGIAVPDVLNQPQADASAAIANALLTVGAITKLHSLTTPLGGVISQEPAANTQVLPQTAIDLLVSLGGLGVPDVVGLTLAAAIASITDANLAAGNMQGQFSGTVPAGNVISQTPVAGMQALPGATVELVVSRGPELVPVPGVVGQAQAEAGNVLTGAGLTAGAVTPECSDAVAAGLVISQTPMAGEQAPPGSVVTLVVSTGNCGVTVPDMVGQTVEAATAAIGGATLGLGAATRQCGDTAAAGLVTGQSPAAGMLVTPGSAVELTVSSGPCQAEGEGEGPAPTEAELREMLAGTFYAADTNGDGVLSYAEVLALMPGLTREVFNTVDSSGDGVASRAEAVPDEDGACAGCAGGKAAFTPGNIRKSLGDLFLGALGLMVLLVVGKRRS
jgi:beta-lactam-binding protein with PASTA domain